MSGTEMSEIVDPKRIVTDELVLRQLSRLGIDKDYVEFWHDYAPRSLGKEHSPYAKFYRDLKSNKRFMVVSGLPKVNADGVKIGGDAHNQPKVGWELQAGKYVTKPNIFSGTVKGLRVELTNLNDQPPRLDLAKMAEEMSKAGRGEPANLEPIYLAEGTRKGDTVSWEPQLFLNNIEQTCGEAVLLETDPTNQFYHNNVLEWDYGICKRRLRVIEGRCRERWIFSQNPQGEVRIKHNKEGAIRLKLGEYAVNDDEELIPASVFADATYPLEIGASPETFYPDAGIASVDGGVQHFDPDGLAWADIVAGAGTHAYDSNDGSTTNIMAIRADGNNNEFDLLYKAIFLFVTSGLPDAANVTAGVFSICGWDKIDEGSITPDINVYASTPFSNTALQADDFVDVASTPFCDTPITYAGWNTAGYNDFTLNAAGRAAISKTSITKLGTRNANYDVSGTPPDWSSGDLGRVQGYYTEKGTGFKPKLVVTYEAPPPVAVTAPFSVDPKPRTRMKFHPTLGLG